MSNAANAANPNAVQGKTEFTFNTQYYTFSKDKMKVEDDGMNCVKSIDGLAELKIFDNKIDKHLEKLISALLKPKGQMSTQVGCEGENGFIPL